VASRMEVPFPAAAVGLTDGASSMEFA
jgi:hypothetical protein